MDEFRISDIKRSHHRNAAEGNAPPSASRQRPVIESAVAGGDSLRNILQIEETTIRHYWETVVRYRTVVIGIALAVFLVTILYGFTKPNQYMARVELLQKQEQPSPLYSPDTQILPVETLMKIAVSRPVLVRAAALVPETLKEVQADGYNIPDEDWQNAGQLTGADLLGYVSAELDKDSLDILYLDAVYPNSRFIVAAVANAMSQSLQERISDINQKKALQKCNILEGLLEVKQKEIHAVESEILSLKRLRQEEKTESFTAIAADEERLLNLVSEYEMLFQENKLKTEELQEQINALKRELGVEGIPTGDIHWVDNSNVMDNRLENLNMQRAELLTRYTRDNPLVTRIESQINAIKKINVLSKVSGNKKRVPVDLLRSKTVTQLIIKESELQGIVPKLESIKRLRDDLNSKLIELPIKTLKIERLKRQKKILETLADDLRHNYQAEKIASKSKVAEVEIIESAFPPDAPFYPNRLKFVLVGLMSAVFLGLLAAFCLDHWDNSINSTREIKSRFNIDPLGLVPLWSDQEKFISASKLDEINIEVYGVLRNNIRYSSAERPEKCLLIASALQSEGKSLTAVNLACSFAVEGNRTLVVALDLRNKRDYFGLRIEDKMHVENTGMTDFLAGEAEYADIIYATKFENLYVLPSGEKRKNPSMLLKQSKLRTFIKDMEKKFDVVILDAPAVLPVVDSTIISPLVRGVLLVIAAGKTPIGACQQAISRLKHVNSPIIGAVLNKAKDMRLDFFYGSGYEYVARSETNSASPITDPDPEINAGVKEGADE
jgi:capsular exopolysaccharide synthesis family protein